MNRLFSGNGHTAEDILALRRAIAQLADDCHLDLGDKAAVRQFMDGDFSRCTDPSPNRQTCRELREMITLLLRIEASSSEDIGIIGLRRLWNQHREVLARFHLRKTIQLGLRREFSGL